MDPKKLRQERAKRIADARAILEAAEKEGRDLTQEEQNQWDAHMDEADKLLGRIERVERQMQLDGQLAQSQQPPVHLQVQTMEQVNELAGEARQGHSILDSEVINPILHRYLEVEQQDAEARARQLRRQRTFARFLPRWIAQDFRGLGAEEWRALQADLDVAGGYLRPPEQFIDQLIKNIDDQTYIRQWATTFSVTNSDSLGVPTLEADPADADWTSELATGNEDTAMSFGKRELHPRPLAKRIKVSRKLIRQVPNSEELVRMRLAYKFGITFEKAGMTGNGANQPLGLFVASNDGIPTSRDVSEGNTATTIEADNLINVKYAVKAAYWPRCRWLFHRDGMKQIAKLKDGNGQYLWRENVRVGEPDTVLGHPAGISEYAPNTFSASQYVGMFGDFSFYWIADALTFELQLLQELYAETNQVGLIGRMESDGQPVLAEAFARVKLGA
jgi:HK97 family phage major capsid protein